MLHFSRYFFYCNIAGYKWYYRIESGASNLWSYLRDWLHDWNWFCHSLYIGKMQLISRRQKNYFSNALIWDAIVSVIFIAAGLFFPGQVMRVMGADAVIEAIGIPYIRIVLCFTPFFMMNYAFTAFVRNDNAPHIAMAATLLSSLFNIVFDYIFMFPLGMGMTGAALATAVSPIVSILICMVHYLSPKSSVSFHLMVPSVKMLISSCSLGVVAFVGEIASAVTTMVFNFVLLGLDGNTAVAAYGVIANTALVGTAIFNGVSQGLQPLASEAHARGEAEGKEEDFDKECFNWHCVNSCFDWRRMEFLHHRLPMYLTVNTQNSWLRMQYQEFESILLASLQQQSILFLPDF
mgnify:CR=1 FL=1